MTRPCGLPQIGDAAPALMTPRVVHRPKIVDVVVTGTSGDRVEVKLADGRQGVIASSDFRDRPVPAVGVELEAAVLARSDPKWVWLSHSWAAKARSWERLGTAKDEHERAERHRAARREGRGGRRHRRAARLPARDRSRRSGPSISSRWSARSSR